MDVKEYEGIIQKLDPVFENKELSAEIEACETEEALKEFFTKHNIALSDEEFQKLMSCNAESELGADDLEQVAGGRSSWKKTLGRFVRDSYAFLKTCWNGGHSDSFKAGQDYAKKAGNAARWKEMLFDPAQYESSGKSVN